MYNTKPKLQKQASQKQAIRQASIQCLVISLVDEAFDVLGVTANTDVNIVKRKQRAGRKKSARQLKLISV